MIVDPDLRSSVYPGVCSDICVRPGIRTTQGIYPSLGGTGGVATRDTKSPSGAADDPTGWISDPGLRSSVYPDLYSGIRVHPGICTTQGIYPSLSGAGGVAAQATKSRGGAADDPTGWIADPGLRTSVHPDVCSGIRVWPRTRTTS